MPQLSTLSRPAPAPDNPGGEASLRVRERYLRRRSARRRVGDRGMAFLWVGIGALVSWLFIVGFAALGH